MKLPIDGPKEVYIELKPNEKTKIIIDVEIKSGPPSVDKWFARFVNSSHIISNLIVNPYHKMKQITEKEFTQTKQTAICIFYSTLSVEPWKKLL